MSRPPFTIRTKAAMERAKQILDCISARPMTAAAIASELGIHKVTVNQYLSELRGDRVRIVKWVRSVSGRARDYPTAVWGRGSGPDAPKPSPKTRAQYVHDYYLRTRQHPDLYPNAELRRKRRSANQRNNTLIRRLREKSASNPLEALVNATLTAKRRS